MKVQAFIEKGNDGTFGVYISLDETRLNYGVIGEGTTPQEAIEDFMITYEDVKEIHAEEGKEFIEAEFEFSYDIASFLTYYSNIFSKSALERITGVNQKQLFHYASGLKKPSEKTIKKIDSAIHKLAEELSQVHFA